ncbi:hypothetical protein BG011_003080 [Mortierella polycephala]|uniref:Uncharacterized protein n=1 Tax=Mortierella polycephala TaxID=41804 RepID=A0A9P6Q5C0_9FUNG|nr:hypothetical protein BG011_003080 [Mortierella polycephala]
MPKPVKFKPALVGNAPSTPSPFNTPKLEKFQHEPPFKRDGKKATPNEYALLMHVHRYLQGAGPGHDIEGTVSPRKLLSLVSGISERVASEAIRMYHRQLEPPTEVKKLGRPDLILDPGLVQKTLEIVNSTQENRKPPRSGDIAKVLTEHGYNVNARTLRHYLPRMGLVYNKDLKRYEVKAPEAQVINSTGEQQTEEQGGAALVLALGQNNPGPEQGQEDNNDGSNRTEGEGQPNFVATLNQGSIVQEQAGSSASGFVTTLAQDSSVAVLDQNSPTTAAVGHSSSAVIIEQGSPVQQTYVQYVHPPPPRKSRANTKKRTAGGSEIEREQGNGGQEQSQDISTPRSKKPRSIARKQAQSHSTLSPVRNNAVGEPGLTDSEKELERGVCNHRLNKSRAHSGQDPTGADAGQRRSDAEGQQEQSSRQMKSSTGSKEQQTGPIQGLAQGGTEGVLAEAQGLVSFMEELTQRNLTMEQVQNSPSSEDAVQGEGLASFVEELTRRIPVEGSSKGSAEARAQTHTERVDAGNCSLPKGNLDNAFSS